MKKFTPTFEEFLNEKKGVRLEVNMLDGSVSNADALDTPIIYDGTNLVKIKYKDGNKKGKKDWVMGNETGGWDELEQRNKPDLKI